MALASPTRRRGKHNSLAGVPGLCAYWSVPRTASGGKTPANHKWFRGLAVAQIVVEHLEELDMRYPAPTVDLKRIRREYHEAEEA